MQEIKLESSHGPTVNPATVATVLPTQYNRQRLLTWASCHQLPSSSKTRNKPDYLVSSSWSHTAAQPCFSMINPWITPPMAAATRGQKCACMCASVGLSWGRGVITCLFLSRPSTPPLRSSYRRWGVLTVGRRPLLLNRTWDLICERRSISLHPLNGAVRSFHIRIEEWTRVSESESAISFCCSR